MTELDGSSPLRLMDLGGIATHVARPAEAALLYSEIFELGIYSRSTDLLSEDPIIFDVGANIGLASRYFCCARPACRVYAYEPVPSLAEICQLNAARWGLDVHTVEAAVGAVMGSSVLSYYPNAPGLSTLSEDNAFGRAATREYLAASGVDDEYLTEMMSHLFERVPLLVAVTTLAAEVDRLGVTHIDLLKIDVEGAEVDVLLGLGTKKLNLVDQVIAEVAAEEDNVEIFTTTLTSAGFRVSILEASLAPSMRIVHAFR